MVETCRFCDSPAVAVFAMPRGCWCHPDDRRQSLCLHHAIKATPLGGMVLTSILIQEGDWRDELIERFGSPAATRNVARYLA